LPRPFITGIILRTRERASHAPSHEFLAVYWPSGRNAEDPLFAEALARRDPDLRTWFTSQLTFNTSVCARLSEPQSPAGLRGTILAGAREPAY